MQTLQAYVEEDEPYEEDVERFVLTPGDADPSGLWVCVTHKNGYVTQAAVPEASDGPSGLVYLGPLTAANRRLVVTVRKMDAARGAHLQVFESTSPSAQDWTLRFEHTWTTLSEADPSVCWHGEDDAPAGLDLTIEAWFTGGYN